jgi:hypothetical protein
MVSGERLHFGTTEFHEFCEKVRDEGRSAVRDDGLGETVVFNCEFEDRESLAY